MSVGTRKLNTEKFWKMINYFQGWWINEIQINLDDRTLSFHYFDELCVERVTMVRWPEVVHLSAIGQCRLKSRLVFDKIPGDLRTKWLVCQDSFIKGSWIFSGPLKTSSTLSASFVGGWLGGLTPSGASQPQRRHLGGAWGPSPQGKRKKEKKRKKKRKKRKKREKIRKKKEGNYE